MVMDSLKFEIGEFSEGFPWEIRFDYHIGKREFSSESHQRCAFVKVCPHCKEIDSSYPKWCKELSVAIWPLHANQKQYVCPRVIVTKNERGCNGTVVCLDCILEKIEGHHAALYSLP